MTGCYIVFEYPKDAQFPHDIAFQIKDDVANVPPEQSDLKSEIERTLDVLSGVFQPSDSRFQLYFGEILALARYGLISDAAQPVQAMTTLRNLQKRFFDREKGRTIGAHMFSVVRALGIALLIVGVAAVIGAGAASWAGQLEEPIKLIPYIMVVPGLAIGLVFSALVRCRAVTFYDLHAIESDRFLPWMKMLFALVTLVVAAAFLKAGLIEIKIGQTTLSKFDTDSLSAFVFGVVVGIGQEVIISRIESIRQRVGSDKAAT